MIKQFCKNIFDKNNFFTTMVTSRVRVWTDEDRNNEMKEESMKEEEEEGEEEEEEERGRATGNG